MANHVNFNIRFAEVNDEAKEVWKKLTGRLVKENYEYWMGDMWVYEDAGVSKDDVRQYSWTIENLGPKWCYITDFDEDGCQGYSAWSAPEQGLNWILAQMAKVDPKMITEFTYEDEGPNFFGAYVYEGEEVVDGAEWDWDELITLVIKDNSELEGKYNEEDQEFIDDESQDLFYEVMWETVHDEQSRIISDAEIYLQKEQDA
jgi:hypothetical protein